METTQPKLRFPKYKEGWKESIFKDICKVNPTNKNLPDKFIYIDLESVNDGILSKENEIELINAPSRAQRLLEFNDVLFQTVRPYQKNNLFFNKKGQYVASTGYAQLRAKANTMFLFQYIHNQKFVDKVIAKCTGTSYPSINSGDLSMIDVVFPSIEEQTKIANFLSAVDEKINLLKEKKSLLEEYKKGIMQKIFNQDPSNSEQAKQIRFKDDNGNDFEDWEEKSLGEIGDISTGKTPSTADASLWNGDIQFITPTDIKEGVKIQQITNRYVTKNNKIKILPTNTIIYTCIASIGKMCISKFPCITNQQINSLIINQIHNYEYVYYWLLYITPFIKSTQANTTLPIINKTDFSNFLIDLPCLKEQTKIANFLSSIDEKIALVNTQIQDTQEYKKGLLQQMFV